MTFSSDMDFEGHLVPLDMDTADRLLAGTVAPEDAPPGYAEVTRLLAAAEAEPTADENASEAEIVAKIVDVVRSSSASFAPEKSRKAFGLTRPRIAAALVAAGLACSTGLASAGALPDAIEQVAFATLAKVGISVPDSNDSTPKAPNGKAEPGGATSDAGKNGERPGPASVRNRAGVERPARPTTVAGVGKGRAGQRRSPSKTSTRAGAGKGRDRSPPPVTMAEPTVVRKHPGPAAAASGGRGRAAQHRSVSRRSSSSSKARAAAPTPGGKSTAAAEPRSKAPKRSRPANAGNDARDAPGSKGAGGGQGGGGSGSQGSGGSGNGNSGHPRGP